MAAGEMFFHGIVWTKQVGGRWTAAGYSVFRSPLAGDWWVVVRPNGERMKATFKTLRQAKAVVEKEAV